MFSFLCLCFSIYITRSPLYCIYFIAHNIVIANLIATALSQTAVGIEGTDSVIPTVGLYCPNVLVLLCYPGAAVTYLTYLTTVTISLSPPHMYSLVLCSIYIPYSSVCTPHVLLYVCTVHTVRTVGTQVCS